MLALTGNAGAQPGEAADAVQLRGWVEKFKQSDHGPFERIRWFCKDGAVLEPIESACRNHGGGRQHGDWKKSVLQMRQQGYLVANVLAALEADQFVGDEARLDDLRQIMLEQFLVRADDGWVFRRSRFLYRGSLQSEDEQASTSRILLAMFADPAWQSAERFLLLREAVRMLPLTGESQLSTRVRQVATELCEKDADFQSLRIKIHSMPDDQDPARVRGYALTSGKELLLEGYEHLAMLLDELYAPLTGVVQLKQLAKDSSNRDFDNQIEQVVKALSAGEDDEHAFASAASSMRTWRQLLQGRNRYSPLDRLRMLQASLILEREISVRGNRLAEALPQASRLACLGWLRHYATALYGTGLISERQWQALQTEMAGLLGNTTVAASDYHAALHYLTRVSQWAQRSLEFHFSEAVQRWSVLTPLTGHLVPDRLRESPLLPFSRVLDQLLADAGRLTGIRHKVFGSSINSSLRALNPGLSRGVLLLPPSDGKPFRSDGIYILPSTTQELPPVAGIITSGEGSSLSHVQLLARNMGIPNLVADEELLLAIRGQIGESIVLAVSRRGSVAIEKNSPEWDKVFGAASAADNVKISADMNRLNLRNHAMYALRRVRADDSGRIVGPKAANLGELRSYYPDMVSPGLVIPFAVFRNHLNKPLYEGGPAVFDRMRSEYGRLKKISDTVLRQKETTAFLSRLREWITTTDPGAAFRQQLHFTYGRVLGTHHDEGVFVRSDTNVEDLPGFSGAGLNLTVPNVVGMEALVNAIQQVWASPFSERAYAWRQAHMSHPEHVYPAVLLLRSFASEKSGVMVTADVDSGDRNWLTIAVSEGVGGAVDGQAAEEIRVERKTGRVRLMAQATAPRKLHLLATGGGEKIAASGSEQLLSASEIEQLRLFAADVEKRFPLPRDETGKPMAADVEFGFAQGKLVLFQLRPFVESRRARQSEVLIAMGRQSAGFSGKRVDLGEAPLSEDFLP